MTGVRLPHDWFPRDVPANVSLGERSWLYSSFAFIHFRSERPHAVEIGSDTGVYDGSFFDLGTGGSVRIGRFCTVVGAIFRTDRRVEVGDYSFLAHEVVVADSFAPSPPWEGAPAVPADDAPSVVIGENCWVGARAVLLGGARIGDGAVVGAATVVDCEVPPFTVVAGNPARVVRSLR